MVLVLGVSGSCGLPPVTRNTLPDRSGMSVSGEKLLPPNMMTRYSWAMEANRSKERVEETVKEKKDRWLALNSETGGDIACFILQVRDLHEVHNSQHAAITHHLNAQY